MTRLNIVLLLAGVATVWSACGRLPEPRSASVLEYTPIQGEFLGATPAALTDASSPSGPAACAEERCPTMRNLLGTVFETESEESVSALLGRVDAHMSELKARAEDHFVPCLEESGTDLADVLAGKVSIASTLHCYAHYPSPVDPEKFPFYEQLLFSRGDAASPVVADRQGSVDDNVTTIWARRDVAGGTVDVWRATSRTLANSGKSFFQVRLGQSRTFEVASAAFNQFSGETPLSCGVQIKGNAELVFVSGRFYPVNDAVFARVPSACDDLETKTFCVKATDFSSVAGGQCEAAGLDAFTLLTISPAELELAGSEWGKAVNIDRSDDVQRFSLSGLDIY